MRSVCRRRFLRIQAAVAAVHAKRQRPPRRTGGTGSPPGTICKLQADPSPVVESNRAVAIAMAIGPEPAYNSIEAILERASCRRSSGTAVRADLLRRLVATRRHETPQSLAMPKTSSRSPDGASSNNGFARFLEKFRSHVEFAFASSTAL